MKLNFLEQGTANFSDSFTYRVQDAEGVRPGRVHSPTQS